jgi:hypothetical protein
LPHDQLLRSVADVMSLKRPSQRTVPAETDRALATRLERTENFILAAERAVTGD